MDRSDDPIIIDELFRKVRPEEISDDLKELGVDIDPKAFKNPTADESLGIYSVAIQVIYGKTVDDIRPEERLGLFSDSVSIIDGVDIGPNDIDFLKCGIGNLRYWRYCQRLHQTLGLEPIERYELFNPTPESFNRFITAFDVYLRFRDAVYKLFETTIASLNLLSERDMHVTRDIRSINDEYDKFKKVHNETLDEHRALSNQKETLEKKLVEAKNLFNEYKHKKNEIEGELEDVKHALSNTLLSKTKERCLFDDLSDSFIIDSAAVEKILGELDNEFQIKNGKIGLLKKNVTDLRLKYDNIVRSCTFLEELGKNLQHHHNNVTIPHVDSLQELKKLKAQCDSLGEKIKILTENRNFIVNKLEHLKKLQKQKLGREQEESQLRINLAKRFAEDTEKSSDLIREKISETNERIEGVVLDTLTYRQNTEELFHNLNRKIKHVATATKCYNERIMYINSKLQE
ncbi:hypothetical protein BEWA_017890 [Theileria equi strain WA]|uniref:Kinetochore protein Nuf2 N-terminal domain-containing protein n=1 Tax=Theileria equi strain WA TaxID=1537102 RepID=L0AUP5_THEEQ|nr:hypothetical protein BEWA_017890 [Theileria equi strain WA]AFZ78948.1 hypothetical protein BEWA_017890 [Theileria equi strain WA]|eukprot:XP_004828614.1 hypothetical protein BEWA_017890 [Theileria equi strain WA]